MRNWIIGLLAVFTAFCAAPAIADDKAGPDDAVALVRQAIAFYKANGKDKTMEAIMDPASALHPKGLYVMVTNLDGMTLAHGANKALVGKDAAQLKDANGKLFIQDMLKTAREKGSGWVDYSWANPTTKKIEAKSTYSEVADGLLFQSGIYK